MPTRLLINTGPIKKRGRTLSDEVVEQLTEKIHSGSLEVGKKLPTESEFVEAFGVSRSVIREAISQLQARGLVETRHGVGTFVREPSIKDVIFDRSTMSPGTAEDLASVLEVRACLESEAAGLAAQRRTEDQLAELERILRALVKEDISRDISVDVDFQFHEQIAKSTHNSHFLDLLRQLGKHAIPRSRLAIFDQEKAMYQQRLNMEHEAIFNAIAAQDADGARAAMRMHIINSRQRMRSASK